MNSMVVTLIIFVISIILYAINIWPLGITAMLSLMALVLTKSIEPEIVLSSIGNANVVIIVGMFVVAAGLRRTTLINSISSFIRKITKGSFKLAYSGVLILGAIVTSLITSPMVAYAICFPIMDAVCEEYKISPSKAQFPLAIVCIAGCAILPFGFAISQAAVFNGLLETYGFASNFDAIKFTIGRWPMLFIVLAWAIYIAPRFTPDKPITEIKTANKNNDNNTKKNITPFQNVMGGILFFGTILGLAFSTQLGIPSWQIVLTACLLEVVFGVMSGKEAIEAMAIDIGLMFVGANGMANALISTGAGDFVGNLLSNTLGGGQNALLISSLFFIIPFILTQFMLNQGVINIFAPIALLVAKSMGADPTGLLILITAGSLTAFMSPSATPAIPITMGAGGYDVKSLFTMGWSISLILIPAYIIYVNLVFPLF
jgi:di/tricarboxylate transporter